MRILAINGSHRPGKGTAALLQAALDAAQGAGAETELVELARLDIGYCIGCNACLAKPADGIIVGSPDYFANVSARTKTFIDRTRPLHMVANALKGKAGGAVTTSGLVDCGAEETLGVLDRFFATHEMLVVHPRPKGPVKANGTAASQFAGLDEEGRIRWRRVQDDATAFAYARQLGEDMVELLKRLG